MKKEQKQDKKSPLVQFKGSHRYDQKLNKCQHKTSSLSVDNSSRDHGVYIFQRNISFPSINSLKHKRKDSAEIIKDVQNVVKQEQQQTDGKYHLRHIKQISDRDEFNRSKSLSSGSFLRGKSISNLRKVQEDKQQQQLPKGSRKRRNSRIDSFIDKDQFNKQKTGISPLQQSFNHVSSIKDQPINSIAQIQESKQGLTVTLTPLSSDINLIVDQVDRHDKHRDELKIEIIEPIQQQKVQQDKEQPVLHSPLHKLKQQKQLMKKIIKTGIFSTDVANLQNQNLTVLTQTIKQCQQNAEDDK